MYLIKRKNSNIMNSFNELFNGWLDNELKADIIENEKSYELIINTPGVNKENIDLRFQDDSLIVSIKCDENIDESTNNYLIKERYISNISRSFYLKNSDENNIYAKLENGVLYVCVNKLMDKSDKKNIVIE